MQHNNTQGARVLLTATLYNTLQHFAAHSNTPQHSMQHTATHKAAHALLTATFGQHLQTMGRHPCSHTHSQKTATHCNTLQCNALQHRLEDTFILIPTHNRLQHTATATHCNCNTSEVYALVLIPTHQRIGSFVGRDQRVSRLTARERNGKREEGIFGLTLRERERERTKKLFGLTTHCNSL